MERDSVDALEHLEMAEWRFASHDTVGAMRRALMARDLYPSHPGLLQAIAAYDVHLGAAKKLPSGDADWYAVLGVDPHCDRDAVKRHFRRMSLLVHPDKNRSVAAEGAFKLLRQAWEAVSASSPPSTPPRSSPADPTFVSSSTPPGSSSAGSRPAAEEAEGAPTKSSRREPSCPRCGVDLGSTVMVSCAFRGGFSSNVKCRCPSCGTWTNVVL